MIFRSRITKKDLDRYQEIARTGNPNRALDLFISAYINPATDKYQAGTAEAMRKAERVLSPDKLNRLMLSISTDTTGLSSALNKLFNQFNRSIFSGPVFKKLGITNVIARKAILNNTIAQFKELTLDSLSRTNTTILRNIRSMQNDLIRGSFGKLSEENILKRVLKSHPDYVKMVTNDQFVTYKDGSMHKMTDYTEMSVRTTTLNVERNGVEMNEMILDRRISEYYRSDKTTYKTNIRRRVCAEIMSKKFKGMALVAHDAAAARVFGILTLAEAKARTAFGPNCRHGIKPIPAEKYNKIDIALKLSEATI